tara:strand:+ start:18171 stop:18383 length:213 start_codon:yes stop_codon:yes gene_type:complete
VIESYLNREKGIDYNLGRTSHSCDFGTGNFTYIDEGDTTLESFSLEHNQKYDCHLLKKQLNQKVGNWFCI